MTPWTVAHQALLSMEFSRQEYWSVLPFSSPAPATYCVLFEVFIVYSLSPPPPLLGHNLHEVGSWWFCSLLFAECLEQGVESELSPDPSGSKTSSLQSVKDHFQLPKDESFRHPFILHLPSIAIILRDFSISVSLFA